MKLDSNLQSWIVLVFLSLIWGTSFILIKKTLIAFGPVEVALLRVSISALAFSPLFLFSFRKLEWHRWKFYAIIGLTGSVLPAFLYATAQTGISSASAGILNSLTPIFTLIIGVAFFKNTTGVVQILGIVLGFFGAAGLIILDATTGTGTREIFLGLLIVLGTLFYGTNVNLIKTHFQNVNPIHLSSFSFILTGIPALFIIPFTDIPNKIAHHPYGMQALGYLTILAVVSTVIALVIFYRLVQKTDAVFASSVAFLIPIVALMWGFVDNEPIGPWHALNLAIIIIGVYLIRKGAIKKEVT